MDKAMSLIRFGMCAAIILGFGAGCVRSGGSPIATASETPVPPEQSPAVVSFSPDASSTPTRPSITARPTARHLPSPTPECSDGLTFLNDLTVPDGTLIGRGVEVDKRWEVLNSGTCNWDKRYRLALISGPELGLPKEQALYPARAGMTAVIRMLLTAPVSPGVYTSAWQALNPDGDPFGEVIFVEIRIN